MKDRIEVLKTYKTYVDGKFLRSESDRTYRIVTGSGNIIANACRCTRKDVRDAMVSARNAFPEWKNRSAYNRGQILYRIAEMMEDRKQQFIGELEKTGLKSKKSEAAVETAVDRLIYYAGWTDKYQQVFSTVNPVASDHFNFSKTEPVGVVGIIAPEESALTGLISVIAPVIAGGNSCLVLASVSNPLPALSFAEVLHSSDVPSGVVNILSGYREDLIPALASHMDLNAVWNTENNNKIRKQIDENTALNIKRVTHNVSSYWDAEEHENPYFILDFQEIKTTWHPSGY